MQDSMKSSVMSYGVIHYTYIIIVCSYHIIWNFVAFKNARKFVMLPRTFRFQRRHRSHIRRLIQLVCRNRNDEHLLTKTHTNNKGRVIDYIFISNLPAATKRSIELTKRSIELTRRSSDPYSTESKATVAKPNRGDPYSTESKATVGKPQRSHQ
jgi:hypothetical protein